MCDTACLAHIERLLVQVYYVLCVTSVLCGVCAFGGLSFGLSLVCTLSLLRSCARGLSLVPPAISQVGYMRYDSCEMIPDT